MRGVSVSPRKGKGEVVRDEIRDSVPGYRNQATMKLQRLALISGGVARKPWASRSPWLARGCENLRVDAPQAGRRPSPALLTTRAPPELRKAEISKVALLPNRHENVFWSRRNPIRIGCAVVPVPVTVSYR